MSKVRRMVAFLTVIILVGLIIGTFICGLTGSEYFFGMLFLSFVVPVVLWVFMWFTRLVTDKSKEEDSLDEENSMDL